MSKNGPVEQAFADLRRDLIHPDGPRISTMRNYRFAIVQYAPEAEFEVRAQVQRLAADLAGNGWSVLSINLQKLLFAKIRSLGDQWRASLVEMERRLAAQFPDRALNHLVSRLQPLVEGPDGIAADCSRMIRDHVAKHPDQVDRTVALIGRAGALYPFFRTSGLLRHLDGHTENVPVVLLYPGERKGQTGLSFMGMLPADNDYRPRIYPDYLPGI
jgi:hypothetical protein